MKKLVLVTGGNGFLGINLVGLLLESGYAVRILDNLNETPLANGSEDFPSEVEIYKGDLRNRQDVKNALISVDAVVHLASIEGIGSSMYKIQDFTDHNCMATSVLLEVLAENPVENLVVASSMAVYGEGLYKNSSGNLVQNVTRRPEDLEKHYWNICDHLDEELTALPTPETKSINPVSVYGLSKYYQERLCLLSGSTFGFPVTVLRFFNIYGPGHSMSNAGGDVLAKFGARILNNVAPLLFEDGFQLRDFLHVKDAARACLLAMEACLPGGNTFNIGSGKPMPVRELALKLAIIMERNGLAPQVSQKFRAGDVRHCFPDISLAADKLDFSPSVDFDEGIFDMAEWLKFMIGTSGFGSTFSDAVFSDSVKFNI